MDLKTRISVLWIVVMFNMVFADILSFITPGAMAEILTGKAGEIQISQELLLVFALFLEVPIAMIFLSRILPARKNRNFNVVASLLTIVFVVGGGSLYLHYIFFAAVEVICMLFIIRCALQLPHTEGHSSKAAVYE
jgi:uncharacterized membrane protein YhaH (DUF805 family)